MTAGAFLESLEGAGGRCSSQGASLAPANNKQVHIEPSGVLLLEPHLPGSCGYWGQWKYWGLSKRETTNHSPKLES